MDRNETKYSKDNYQTLTDIKFNRRISFEEDEYKEVIKYLVDKAKSIEIDSYSNVGFYYLNPERTQIIMAKSLPNSRRIKGIVNLTGNVEAKIFDELKEMLGY